jgi:hypothetical protein
MRLENGTDSGKIMRIQQEQRRAVTVELRIPQQQLRKKLNNSKLTKEPGCEVGVAV